MLNKLKEEKPWVRLKVTRRKYEEMRPWKGTGLSRKRWEEVFLMLPDELISEIYRDVDATRLIEAAFKSL